MTDRGTRLTGVVGKATADGLEKAFGLRTVGDLLRHFPRRYVRQGDLSDLAELRPGDYVTVVAEVLSVQMSPYPRGRAPTKVVITDGRHTLDLAFFRQAWRGQDLKPGTRALFAGRLSRFRDRPQLAHPVVKKDLGDLNQVALPLLPVYPATQKVTSWAQAMAVSTVLSLLDELPDPMPSDLRSEHGLMSFDAAIRAMHRPQSQAQADAARVRLKWDEALTVQLALARRRAAALSLPAVPRPERDGGLLTAFDASLPFSLTAGQREVGSQIAADLSAAIPMHRLLAGEVGSGKTVVALRAMLSVVDAGGQAAFLAPTEVLAQQHLRSLRQLLGPLGRAGELGSDPNSTRVELLTASLPAATRRSVLAAAADGSAGIVVGTHALLSEGVDFADLGLVVVDEQHRFGVEQRAELRSRGRVGTNPHLLVMTATPIPRTVAMTVFGDLESSSLTELPGGRKPIATYVVPDAKPLWIDRMWERVRAEVSAGRQAFVVCPQIEPGAIADEESPDSEESDSEESNAEESNAEESNADASDAEGSELDADEGRRPGAAVEVVAPQLAEGELAGLRVATLHGRLPAEEKDAVMTAFGAGSIDVLVATTVVEVGVDVPNASVMVVLDADRFGMSQLHQLRGRIGRGGFASFCFLHSTSPPQTPAGQRLEAVAATTDGGELAEIDLRLRGEGDVLGSRQSGLGSRLALLRLTTDLDIVVAARARAARLIASDPGLRDHAALAAEVDRLLEDAAYLEKG